MQFLKIESDTTLEELSDRVGVRNVSNVLSVNGLSRTYNVGDAYTSLCNDIAANSDEVSWQRKSTVLNSLAGDSDNFEYAALQGENSWKVLSNLGSFPGMLKIPDSVELPDSTDIMGNNEAVPKNIYKSVMDQISTEPHEVDPATFNEFSSIRHASIASNRVGAGSGTGTNVFESFNIPWGEITLYSSLEGEAVDIPVYPESIEDGVQANYTQMPDLLYQYEQWQVYQSSGPRTCSYEFHMHRDMWTGDHTDGGCNDLIRFCQAQCYAEYSGSAVDTPLVTLFVKGSALITGIMTNAKTTWTGPIGSDGWYLEVTLTLTITEVAAEALSYSTVRNKSLIG